MARHASGRDELIACLFFLQGVVSNVLAIESFGAAFPDIYMNADLKVSQLVSVHRAPADSVFEGWFVSTLLLSSLFSGAYVYMNGV